MESFERRERAAAAPEAAEQRIHLRPRASLLLPLLALEASWVALIGYGLWRYVG